MAKQSKRFKCDHGIYGYEHNGKKYVKKSRPEVSVIVGGMAYYYGDGETGFDIDQILFNGHNIIDFVKATDGLSDYEETAQKESDLIYANECASEEKEPESYFEMMAEYTRP